MIVVVYTNLNKEYTHQAGDLCSWMPIGRLLQLTGLVGTLLYFGLGLR